MRKYIILFFLVLNVLTQQTIAQSVESDSFIPVNGGGGGIPELKEKVYYTVLPEKPRSGDLVDISADMYGTPVKDAIFTWKVDGKEFKKGQGLNKISVYVYKGTKVSVDIITVKKTSIFKEWSFNPENVIIFWESQTYTPPFYKGKPLYTPESTLTLHGINLDSKNPLTNTYANYVWKKDGSVQGDDSGVSKRTFIYKGDILQQEPLFELLYTGVTNYQASTDLKTTPVNTRSILRVQTLNTDIFTYEKKPLLGVLFNKKIGESFMFTEKESTLVSYPAYYSVFSPNALNYSWFLNSSLIKENSNFITFKKIKDDEKSILDIQISNPKSLLQKHNINHIIDTTTNKNTESSFLGGFGK